MWTLGICDDDPHFALELSKRLRDLCAVKLPERIDCRVLSSFSSAAEVLAFLENNTINVLFLDIDMPGTNGFQLAEIIREKYSDTVIIFVSAYDDFVYSSFAYSPFRFLRKTHLSAELPAAMDSLIRRYWFDQEMLSFETTEGGEWLRIKDIVLFEGQRNYFVVGTVSGKAYKCRGTLNSVEDAVSKYDFFRVQSSYIVNLEHVEKLDGDRILMRSGEEITIGRQKRSLFRTAYMEFIRRRIVQ